jgi:2',3'-cyclic-nucleotide 2'-phosphodiesterase (5'-nucleotidase family)
MRPGLPVLIPLLVLLGALAPRLARAEDRLDLIFAADLEGWFSPRRCAGPPARMGPGLPALSGAIALARTGETPSLVIGSGLLGSGNLARYLLTRDDGGPQAAALLAGAGIEVLVPGTAEFSMPPAGLDQALRAFAAHGHAPLLSNLRCQGAGGGTRTGEEGRCGALRRSLLLSRGGVRVGLLGVVGESLPRRVGPGHVPGQVQPPAGIAAEIRRLRVAVDAVVVVADLEGRGDPGEAVALVQALDAQGAHADMVLATRQDHRSAAVNVVSLSSGALVVGAPAEGAGVAVVSLQRSPEGRLHLSARRVLAGRPDAGLQARIDRLFGEMCRDWGQEVAQIKKGGLTREDFAVRVLDAMRDAGKAEMAMINAGAIDDRGLPLYAASAAEVNAALPYPARVVLLKLPGKDVSERLGKFVSPGPEAGARLFLRGLTRKDGGLEINGRPLDPAATYRVATIDFITAGGDDLLSPEMAAGKVLHDDLRALVLSHFAASGAGTLPLQELPLWTSNLDFGLDLQGTTIQNGGETRYDRPLLLRKPSVALRIDSTARVQMELPRHLLQLSLRGLYGQTYLAPAAEGEAPTWQETADLLNLLALYSYRGLSPRWSIVPTPYASLGLETEWTRSESRGYHHMEVSALAGVRTALLSKLSLVLGAGVRSELLARRTRAEEADLARPRVLLSGTLELLKRSLWPKLGNALLGEGTLTYNFTDPQFLRSHELRATGKLYISLGRPLYVTLGLDLYLYGDRGRPPGLSLDVTCGLKVLLLARTQVFSPPVLPEGAKPLPNRTE